MAKLGPDQRVGYKKVPVIEGYDLWAPTYDTDSNPLVAVEEKHVLELVGDVRGQRVLDLGCGTGRYCSLLTERGAKVVGVDPSPEMLQHARQKVTPTSQFELHQGTIDETRFSNEHFDLIVCALTFGHLPELEPTFREAVRILKNGGWMVVSDLHPYWPVSGHNYTEFSDDAGQEYRLPLYAHLVEEYWHLCRKFSLQLKDIREPVIDGWLIERFASLEDYRGTPLAIVLKLEKSTDKG